MPDSGTRAHSIPNYRLAGRGMLPYLPKATLRGHHVTGYIRLSNPPGRNDSGTLSLRRAVRRRFGAAHRFLLSSSEVADQAGDSALADGPFRRRTAFL